MNPESDDLIRNLSKILHLMIRCCDHLFSMLLMTTLINPLTKIPWRAPAKQIRTIWIKRNHPHRHYIDHNCQSCKEKDLFSTNPRLTAQRRRRRLLPACISTWSSWSWSRLSSWSWSLVIVKIVIMIIRLVVIINGDDDNNEDDDDDYDNDDTSIAGPSTDLRLASKLWIESQRQDQTLLV